MGWVERAPSGNWKASWREPDGRKRSRTKSVDGVPFRRKEDAKAFLDETSHGMRKGTYTDPNLGKTKLMDFWPGFLSASPHLRPTTRSNYEFMATRHILPDLGHRQLASLTRLDIERWVATLADHPPTAVSAFRVLRRMLSVAEAGGYVGRNVARGVSLPKPSNRGMRFLSAEELARITDVIDPRFRALVLLLGLTGPRIGEASALLVEDVDLLRRRMNITKAITEVEGQLVAGPTKTGKSRAVSLPQVVVDELARHLAQYPADRRSPLFTGTRGALIRRTNFRRQVWLPALREAGIEPPFPRVHDLRHTAASLAIAAGGHPKAVQEMLGHSSITVTLDRYGHLFPALSERLAEAMDAGYREATGQPVRLSEEA